MTRELCLIFPQNNLLFNWSACSAGDTRDMGWIPGSERSTREGNGTPVSLPGKSHGQRSLVGTVHGVAKSQTQLSDFSSFSRCKILLHSSLRIREELLD